MFSASWITKVLGLPNATGAFTTIVSDSRKITPGCLFVALRGEKFDGHTFIPQAIAQGATGILCECPTTSFGVQFFTVPDTLKAYRSLAGSWRSQFQIPIIAVVGSVGKTTVKELTSAILSGKYSRVLKTQGSQNGYLGLALTLLELRPDHSIAVIEIGIDDIHAMQEHLDLVRPTACILTAIQEEHLEKLISIEIVSREECLALTWIAKHRGIAIINWDDPRIRTHAQTLEFQSQFIFSLEDRTHPSPPLPHSNALHGQVQGSQLKTKEAEFELPLLGTHNARNLLGALAVAQAHGLTTAEMQKGLSTFQGADGRTQIKYLPLNHQPQALTVICDYYNASPASTQAGLKLLHELPAHQRWVCLGDMLELGSAEHQFHQDLAPYILAANIKHVFLYGPRMKALETALQPAAIQVRHFESHEALALALAKGVQPQDAVLIKGSRSMKMELVWTHLQKLLT